MKKIFLTIALSGALGIYTLQAQTQSPRVTPQPDTAQRQTNDPNMATFPTDTTMQSPMRQDDQQNMRDTPENQEGQPGRTHQEGEPMQRGTQMQEGQTGTGTGSGGATTTGHGEVGVDPAAGAEQRQRGVQGSGRLNTDEDRNTQQDDDQLDRSTGTTGTGTTGSGTGTGDINRSQQGDSQMRDDNQNWQDDRKQKDKNKDKARKKDGHQGMDHSRQDADRSGVGAGEAQQAGYGEEDGMARESLNPDSDFMKNESNTIRYNEPIERGHAPVPRAQDNMRQGTQRPQDTQRQQGTGTGTGTTTGQGQDMQRDTMDRDTLDNNQNIEMRDSDDPQRTTTEPSRTTDPNRTRQPAGSTDPGTRTTTPPQN
jgi:hypothetical protein